MRRLRSVALAVQVLCLAPGLTAAGSPSPDASPGTPGTPGTSPDAPGASPTAHCSDLAASIRERVGASLEATATSGVEGIDPDDLLDPLLRSLGRDRTDVCGVTLRTADPPRAGMLLRIRGGGPALAEALARALADRLRAYGQVVSTDQLEVGGVPVSRLLVGAAASGTPLLVMSVAADAVLVTDSTELAGSLLAALSRKSPRVPPGPPASAAPSAHG